MLQKKNISFVFADINFVWMKLFILFVCENMWVHIIFSFTLYFLLYAGPNFKTDRDRWINPNYTHFKCCSPDFVQCRTIDYFSK